MGPAATKQPKMEAGPPTALEEAPKIWLAQPRPEGGASSLLHIASGLGPSDRQPQGHARAVHTSRASHAWWHERPARPMQPQPRLRLPCKRPPTEGCSPLPGRYGPDSD